jgi:hypothetical protein
MIGGKCWTQQVSGFDFFIGMQPNDGLDGLVSLAKS